MLVTTVHQRPARAAGLLDRAARPAPGRCSSTRVETSRRRRRGPSEAGPDRPSRPGGLTRVPRPRQAARSSRPQLAMRVAIVGGIALVAFAVIFFRLWYLQVLSGDKYRRRGERQPVRDDQDPGAARRDRRPQRQGAGRQPHRAGRARSRRRTCPRSEADRREVYDAGREGASGSAGARVRREVERTAEGAAVRDRRRSRATCRRTPSATCSRTRTRFPGVTVERVFLRSYPHKRDRRARCSASSARSPRSS